MKIGVFDSGKGGVAVAAYLREVFPDEAILFADDHAHVPYGTKTAQEIFALTDAAIQPLLSEGCNPIVIACNTATALAIERLRLAYPQTGFIGIEPMVKPAALHSKTKRIAVLATPATIGSTRYRELKARWARECVVIEPDCSTWATLIENGDQDTVQIESVVELLVAQSIDAIVLGCTHYHWLADRARTAARGKATVYEPSQAIALRVTEIRSKVAARLQ